MPTNMKRCLRIGLVLLALTSGGACARRVAWQSPQKHAQVLDELAAADLFRSPTCDPANSMLAYVHRGPAGRELCLLDLKSLARTDIKLTNEVTKLLTWSPDGRYLAFVQTPYRLPGGPTAQGSGAEKESWVTVYDRHTGDCRWVGRERPVVEDYLAWLTPHQFLLVSRKLGATDWDVWLGQIEGGPLTRVSDQKDFVVMSENEIAYVQKGEILSQHLEPLPETGEAAAHGFAAHARRLSDFKTNGFDRIRWLCYDRAERKFLFCARPANSTWRYLYYFDPDPETGQLARLNEEDTYSGQWLQAGAGFAFVGNPENHFYLAVRTLEPAWQTNLFTLGSLDQYRVAPDGNRLYAVAALGIEPQGIWEYTVTNRVLRQLVDGVKSPFVATQLVPPKEYRVKSFDGLEIPCFLFEPVPRPRPGEKRPLVIYLPPPSMQFQRVFQAESQLFANLGFYFLAVNFRGCDGYGRDYASRGNESEAAKDVLAAYRALLQGRGVDARNVFLYAVCGGDSVLRELVADAPELWRAVALRHGGLAGYARWAARKVPPILLLVGDHDVEPGALERFHSWAKANGVHAESVIHTNSDHNGYIYRATEQKVALARVSDFFLKNLK